ncbi:hypothetical protein GO986_03120 [Deinococcus sp. HMF7620]|uniref:Uncharacterized protein n=1 Tax=Deinococcus arboris TaxID=2682977 RepID=A0A7C9I1I1_9DEIO|nr:Imm51 family immunity protein [Deinococcus arboris]MVN85751.1 hypothetical protein [Deinococcus arboris]
MTPPTSDALFPLLLAEHGSSTSLLLTDFSAGAPVFQAAGFKAGGYACQGVAQALIRLHAPHLTTAIRFDSESSMFTAYSADRAALLALAQLLQQAMTDPVMLDGALRHADPAELD